MEVDKMLGFYDRWSNGPARPVVNKEWVTLPCKMCGVSQTHYKKDSGITWRCAICSETRDGGLTE